MELAYPFVFIIGIIAIILLAMINMKKDHSYEKGKKIANTEFIKDMPYYKEILKKYKMLTYCIQGVCVLSIVMSLILLARPVVVDTSNNPKYARDILLCMDVSASVDELNIELVDNLKDTVKGLKGERFGISIFNSSSVLISPLTDDYDYIIDELDKIHASFLTDLSLDSSADEWYISSYVMSGTTEGAAERGGSLIGDGLASAVYKFSNIDDDRTRIIILSTDNDLAGDPLIELEDAAELCKSKNIIVYGIAPDFIRDADEQSFKKAVELTGGKYYTMSDKNQVKDIINSIEKTSKSLIDGQVETRKIDKPVVPFFILIVSVVGLFILDKKVNV